MKFFLSLLAVTWSISNKGLKWAESDKEQFL